MSEKLKIKETENKNLKRAYEVIIPAASIDQKVVAELNKISKKTKVPGFRAGHVPLKILRQKYSASVMGEVVQGSVNVAIGEVLKNNDLTPALQPKAEIISFVEGGDLSFKMNVEIMPQPPKIDFKKIEVSKQVFDIPAKDVDTAIERVAESNRELKAKAKTAKAALGDIVKIDFKGFLGKEPFAGGEGKDYNLELGAGQFIPGFEDQIVGAKAGDDVTVDVTFPKEYHSEDLAGKKVKFEVKVHEVQETVVPKINDDFAKKTWYGRFKGDERSGERSAK